MLKHGEVIVWTIDMERWFSFNYLFSAFARIVNISRFCVLSTLIE